jgi:signal transduction histidine kinase
MAAIDPQRLTRRLQLADPALRREFESAELGSSWSEIGRDLAQGWGCDPLVADACWLHADLGNGLEDMAADPARMILIQQAYALAERTPWAMSASPMSQKDRLDSELRVRQLIAEVQGKCGGHFMNEDATPREERLTRSMARLLSENARLSASNSARTLLLDTLAASEPNESPEGWSERAGLALCQTPGVSVVHVGSIADDPDSGVPERDPSIEYPLTPPELSDLRIRLWGDTEAPIAAGDLSTTLPAWRAWATLIVDRSRVRNRLARVMNILRMQADSEEPRLRASKLNALAEFAAGAGHELNNPLAVILGRAQLLLVGETDPKAIRGLRAILTQAQRAHRILRDLMYVARPPELRPKFCLPDEILKACLRDAATDAEERGVKLGFESTAPAIRVWADPDGLRHLADALVRNALEATPRGGSIRICTEGDTKSLCWTLHDSGDGITPDRGAHIFDPFYCGRAAGRGLGLGLPRASRFISATGGTLEWRSIPGKGSTFEVRIPLTEPPRSPTLDFKQA